MIHNDDFRGTITQTVGDNVRDNVSVNVHRLCIYAIMGCHVTCV